MDELEKLELDEKFEALGKKLDRLISIVLGKGDPGPPKDGE